MQSVVVDVSLALLFLATTSQITLCLNTVVRICASGQELSESPVRTRNVVHNWNLAAINYGAQIDKCR